MPTAVLDLKHKTCTCRKWQLNGVPCVHAAVVLWPKLNGRYDLVDPFFYTEIYKASYANAIIPFPKLVVCGEGSAIKAPDYHQTRGRPKRRRIASQGEIIPRKMKCGKCGEISNHNKKTCMKMRVEP